MEGMVSTERGEGKKVRRLLKGRSRYRLGQLDSLKEAWPARKVIRKHTTGLAPLLAWYPFSCYCFAGLIAH